MAIDNGKSLRNLGIIIAGMMALGGFIAVEPFAMKSDLQRAEDTVWKLEQTVGELDRKVDLQNREIATLQQWQVDRGACK